MSSATSCLCIRTPSFWACDSWLLDSGVSVHLLSSAASRNSSMRLRPRPTHSSLSTLSFMHVWNLSPENRDPDWWKAETYSGWPPEVCYSLPLCLSCCGPWSCCFCSLFSGRVISLACRCQAVTFIYLFLTTSVTVDLCNLCLEFGLWIHQEYIYFSFPIAAFSIWILEYYSKKGLWNPSVQLGHVIVEKVRGRGLRSFCMLKVRPLKH